MRIKELRECIANMYFSICKGKFCKGCILNKKENSEYTFCKLHYLFHELYEEKKEKAMNYYKQIAEMLGVELGEEFKVKFKEGDATETVYKITQDGFVDSKHEIVANFIFYEVLKGECEIVKLSWKPKKGNLCWFYSPYSDTAFEYEWNGSYGDLLNWKLGTCFRTKEEAETKWKDIMEQIQKEYEEI